MYSMPVSGEIYAQTHKCMPCMMQSCSCVYVVRTVYNCALSAELGHALPIPGC